MIETVTDEIFEDLKACAIQVWSKYDDTHGYRSEKTNYLTRLTNISDNYRAIIQMMDTSNQRELFTLVKLETQMFLRAFYMDYYSEAAKYAELHG